MEVNVKEEVIQKLYSHASQNLDLLNDVNMSAEEEKQITNQTCAFLDKATAMESIDYDYWDKRERREIERERNQSMTDIETRKQHMDWKRFTIEIGKVLGPIAGIFIVGMFNNKFQDKELEFDGGGKIHSSTSSRKRNPFLKM